MTKEERYLLLRDSFARVPYGVKGVNEYGNIITLKDWKTEQSIFDGIRYIINKYNWRPYLFPFSSMTEEQKKEYESLCIKETSEYSDLYGIIFAKDHYYDTVESIDYLYKNHIDVRGLIPLGLAIDCTNLKIY